MDLYGGKQNPGRDTRNAFAEIPRTETGRWMSKVHWAPGTPTELSAAQAHGVGTREPPQAHWALPQPGCGSSLCRTENPLENTCHAPAKPQGELHPSAGGSESASCALMPCLWCSLPCARKSEAVGGSAGRSWAHCTSSSRARRGTGSESCHPAFHRQVSAGSRAAELPPWASESGGVCWESQECKLKIHPRAGLHAEPQQTDCLLEREDEIGPDSPYVILKISRIQ